MNDAQYGFRDRGIERRRVAELRVNLGEPLPQRPAAAVVLGQWRRRAGHRAEARGVGHRGVLQKDEVVGADRDGFGRAVAADRQGGRGKLAVDARDGEIGHDAAVADLDALLLEPALQRADQQIVLVEDRPLDAGERFDAAEFLHEPVQIALELHRAVPRLKGERGLPHIPEFGSKERRRQPIGDAARPEPLFAGFGDAHELQSVAHA